jgi:hypothetical protein
MKMYPDDWQVRLTIGAVHAVCNAVAWILGLVVVKQIWALMFFLVVAVIVGNVLAPPVCRLLFQSSSGGAPEKEQKDEKK